MHSSYWSDLFTQRLRSEIRLRPVPCPAHHPPRDAGDLGEATTALELPPGNCLIDAACAEELSRKGRKWGHFSIFPSKISGIPFSGPFQSPIHLLSPGDVEGEEKRVVTGLRYTCFDASSQSHSIQHSKYSCSFPAIRSQPCPLLH